MINIDFGFYFSLLRKRTPHFLVVAALVLIAGALLAYLLPPTFRATAKLLVESPQIPTELARSTVPTGAMEQFQIIQEDVLSRENLMALAVKYHLYSAAQLVDQSKVSEDMKDRFVIQPVTLDGAGSHSSTVFEVSFAARDPRVAAEVTNELVSMILDKDTELRTARATDTVQFFTQEVTRLDGELKKVDASVLKFKNANIDSLPDSLEFRRGLQATQQQRLLVLAQEATSLQDRMTELRSRPLTARTTPVTPEQKALEDLRTALTTQLEIFSEDSPTIVSIRARIAALEKQVVAAASANATDDDSSASGGDPEMAGLAYRLRANEQETKSLQKTLQQLNSSINATPVNEMTLNSLERNHQNLQAQYDSTVMRLAEASTGQQIELRLKGERLSLIESAVPPRTQVSPKTSLILIASLAAAIALGGATVVLPELLNRRIRRPIELVDRLQIRPLVTVPYITPPPMSHFRRQKRLLARGSGGGLRSVFGGKAGTSVASRSVRNVLSDL